MRIAMAMAEKAEAEGEVPVGAVLVRMASKLRLGITCLSVSMILVPMLRSSVCAPLGKPLKTIGSLMRPYM